MNGWVGRWVNGRMHGWAVRERDERERRAGKEGKMQKLQLVLLLLI